MKKLLKLGLFSFLLMSCNNTGASDLLNEGINQTNEIEMKASSIEYQEDTVLTREKAIELTKEDSNLIAVNYKTNEIIINGSVMPEPDFDHNIATNPDVERKVSVVCKVKYRGVTHAIVHVYDNGYSGYQLVTYNSNGTISASSEMTMGPMNCPSLWLTAWLD